MINIERFELKHLLNFEPKFAFPDIIANMEANMNNPYRECLSLMNGSTLVSIAGVNYLRPGAGEVWLIPGTAVEKNKFCFFKAVKWLIETYLFEHKKLHRLEMAIKADWEQGKLWAKKIGFEYEGMMKQWCPNKEDHLLYARLA